MKCLPAVRCSGLSAFYATMGKKKRRNCRSTDMLKSKINTRLPPLWYVENDIWRQRPVRTSPAHDARLRTQQSEVCSCFSLNHDGTNWGKQLQQAAKRAVAHNQGPGPRSASIASITHRFHSLALCHSCMCLYRQIVHSRQLGGLTSTVPFPRHPTLPTNTSERRQHDDDADDKRGETFSIFF